MTTMFRLSGYYDNEITEHEVVKQTAQQTRYIITDWRGQKVEQREFTAGKWFATKAEAAAEVVKRNERKVKIAKEQYDNARSRLGDVRAKYRDELAKPTESA